jgi:hypothetical protein
MPSNKDQMRVQVTLGSLLVHFKPGQRTFWVTRPAQILATGLTMGLLHAAPVAQVACLATIHTASLASILWWRPFKAKEYFIVTVIVEALRLLCVVLLFAVIDAPSVGVEVATIAINTITILMLCGIECVALFGTLRARFCGRRGIGGGGGYAKKKSTQKNIKQNVELAEHRKTVSTDFSSSNAGLRYQQHTDTAGKRYFHCVYNNETLWALPNLPATSGLHWVRRKEPQGVFFVADEAWKGQPH